MTNVLCSPVSVSRIVTWGPDVDLCHQAPLNDLRIVPHLDEFLEPLGERPLLLSGDEVVQRRTPPTTPDEQSVDTAQGRQPLAKAFGEDLR
jgi:hypothetical protein